MSKHENNVPATSKSGSHAVAAVDESFAQYAGAGTENITASDIIVPRLTILQALSPQLNAKKSEYIAGAKAGDICDVGTGEIFEAPLMFLPVYFKKQWLEWAPRSSGQGLVAIHDSSDILNQTKPNDRKQPILANGNLIAETAQFFGLNLSAGGRRSFLPLTSTQLKKAKRWLTLASAEKPLARKDGSTFAPPLFYRIYQLSAVSESNAKGDWIGYKIERGPSLPDYGPDWEKIRDEAVKFLASLTRGELRGDIEGADHETHSEGAM